MVEKINSISKEMQILLFLSKINIEPEIWNIVEKVNLRTLNWQLITNLAIQHGVGSQFYLNIKDKPFIQFISVENIELLKKSYYAVFLRNNSIFKDLKKILQAANASNIEIILLKGVHLADKYYPNYSYRAMSDIDLMVKWEDMNKMADVLQSIGFKNSIADNSLEKIQKENSLKHHFSAYLSPDGVPVEIHWHWVSSVKDFTIDVNKFWENTVNSLVQNTPVKLLNKVYLLIHLCIHTYSHFQFQGIRLNWFIDKFQLIEKEIYTTDDWNELIKVTIEFNARKQVYTSLFFTEKYFFATIPQFVFDALFVDLKTDEKRFIKLVYKGIDIKQTDFLTYSKKIKQIKGVKNKLIYLSKSFFYSPSNIILRYKVKNKKLLIFYYFYHFFSAFVSLGQLFKSKIIKCFERKNTEPN